MKDVKIGIGFSKGLREWRLLDLLHADDPVLCDELKEDLRVRIGNFAGLCKRIGGGVFSGSAKLLKEWRVVGLKK